VHPETGKAPLRLFHHVDYSTSIRAHGPDLDHSIVVAMCHNDRSKKVKAFLHVFPKHVVHRISEEVAAQWFTPGLLVSWIFWESSVLLNQMFFKTL